MFPPLTLFSVGVADGELVALLVEGASSLLLEQAVKVPIAMIAAPPAKSAQWRVIRREFMIVSHLAGSGPVGRRDWLVRHIVPGVNNRVPANEGGSSTAAAPDFGGQWRR